MASSGAEGGEPNWAWLGLLKWSLSYVDGTVPTEESKNFRQMTDEDKAFLEEVMKNGIVDEGERMKVILEGVVSYLESVKKLEEENNETDSSEKEEELSDKTTVKSQDEIIDLLEELQDIVEQIDYAKSFAAMGGIPFLLGCAAAQKHNVPSSIRSSCLAILATLCQNNPAVQLSMLEQGNIPKLINIYFSDVEMRAKGMQAMSCSVRSHDMGEAIFCMNQEGIRAIETGLGLFREGQQQEGDGSVETMTTTLNLRVKSLFFLQALVTSDSADAARVQSFAPCIQYAATNFCDATNEGENCDSHIRTLTLSMLVSILGQKKSVNGILHVKDFLVGLGVRRVAAIRVMTDKDDKEFAAEELGLWETLIVELARAQRDPEDPVLLLEDRPVDDPGETLPQ